MNEPSAIIREDVQQIAQELEDVAFQLEGATLLIAGGAGFLGRYLVLTADYLNRHVLHKPCHVIVLDNFITGLRERLHDEDHIEIHQHDVCTPFHTERPVDYIMHAASIASPVFYNKYRLETIDVGFVGTKNLLGLAKEKQVKSFLFFSSSEVYGDPDPNFIPTPETYFGNVSCTGPRACYDEPKRIGETLCMTYAELYNLPVKIVRPFNIFGPGMRLDDGRVVPNVVAAALKGEKIPIYGGGTNTRTFCYITNAVVGFYRLLLSAFNKEVFNIGSDEQEMQMRHLGELISGLVGNEQARLDHRGGPNEAYTKSNPNRRCPDLTKIRTMIGYNPRVNLVSGLRRFIEWATQELAQEESRHGLVRACRICGHDMLKEVLSFGRIPLANSLVVKPERDRPAERFPLSLLYCERCHLCQLSHVVSPEKLFRNYLYVSSTTETFRKHFMDMATKLAKDVDLHPMSLVVDIGSNDGILLKGFKDLGMRVVGVEPAENVAQLARHNGIDTINDFLNEEVVREIITLKGQADLVTASNVFAHVGNIKRFTHNVRRLLKDDGVFVIEIQYLLDTVKKLTFDNIYHEHVSYFSLMSLRELFSHQQMEIVKVERVSTHGGSLRAMIQKSGGRLREDGSVERLLEEERAAGLEKFATYQVFADRVNAITDRLKSVIRQLNNGKTVVAAYGAPAKATTLLNVCGIGDEDIQYIVEDNSLKHDHFVPGVNIPIVGPETLLSRRPDYLVILAWNFADEILKKNEGLREQGLKFVLPLPEPKIV